MELDEGMTRTVRELTDRAIRQCQDRGNVPYQLQRLRTHIELSLHRDPDPETDTDLIGVAEAADILGNSVQWVRRIAADLEGRRIGRDWIFQRRAVEEYAAGRTKD